MTNEDKQQLAVWWVLWAAFLVGNFVQFHFLSRTPAQAPAADSPVWLAGLAPLFLSMIVRWIVLPRAQSAQAALPLFIVGMAMAEVTCFLGLFIFSAHQQELFLAGVLGIFQFIPLFARRYFDEQSSQIPKS